MRRSIGFFLVHVFVWTGLVLVVPGGDRVDYDMLGDAATPWMRQFVVALTVVLAIQIAFVTRRKAWAEVFSEVSRSRKVWHWLPAAVLLVLGVGAFARDGLSDAPQSYWIGMSVTMLLVGITEEITFRGIIVAEVRRSAGSGLRTLVVSSSLFGLFHLPNALLGQDGSSTVRQVIVTGVLGMAFFALRRASGSLIPCIALHAVYDWMLIQGTFG